ncbi:hypothetical protein [Thermococcus piezophilus]|uniref:Uncharacterized protein n=1 Tax=Thermococcus piezophilus TaxID=1712654 RepID=A0A172WF73_9EURY|nr:hypothetical protein [Thermococcus piezophilus]ANF22072.1 hypothetical protein A7C91_01850 [Thermococcus piezophilus]
MVVATLNDFLNKLNELEQLRKELKITISDRYNSLIEIEADLDVDNKPYFHILHDHFQTELSLSEMRKLAEWLMKIGILEIGKERDGRG